MSSSEKKRFTVLGYIGLAVVVTALAWALRLFLSIFFPYSWSTLLIAAVCFSYVCMHLSLSPPRFGRFTLGLAAALILSFTLPWITISGLLLLSPFLISTIRSLCTYRSIISFILDVGLSCTALVCTFMIVGHTGSIMVGIWSFFLISSLAAFIPTRFSGNRSEDDLEVDRFNRAVKVAEDSLSRMAA